MTKMTKIKLTILKRQLTKLKGVIYISQNEMLVKKDYILFLF